ncbi:MAG: fluoride efflux transporter CrcB [Geodermatophilaceae bacterium]
MSRSAQPEAAAEARRRSRWRTARVLLVITVGGMLGAVARHAVSLAVPTAGGALPWSTLIVNVTGCLLIGVLMVLILDARQAHPLVRPFIGVGVLGGFTTFSTYAVDAQVLIVAGRPLLAMAYLAGTAAAALVAVQLGVVITRAVVPPRTASRTQRAPSRGGSR